MGGLLKNKFFLEKVDRPFTPHCTPYSENQENQCEVIPILVGMWGVLNVKKDLALSKQAWLKYKISNV